MHGAGNDFVLVEASDDSQDWAALAVAMCDRHYGVGADGLLLMQPSDRASFRMRIFNADGSESSACGNGLRCLVKHYLDSRSNGGASLDDVTVETVAGIRHARIRHRNGNEAQIHTGMGVPSLGLDLRPVPPRQEWKKVDITQITGVSITVADRTLNLHAVSVGNPHAVLFLQEPVTTYPLLQLGPLVEHHGLFREDTNFEIVNVLSPALVQARVWERGVGETLACGSGACAIAVAGQLLGHLGQEVDVRLPGGVLHVTWDGTGEVFLSGPAETVFTGDWPLGPATNA